MDEVVLAGILGGDGAVILHAEIHGIFIAAVHLAEEVCEDLGGAHISVTVGVSQTGAVEVPAEVAGPGLFVLGAGGRGGVGDVASQHGVIALAPLGVVLGHVLGDELVGLAVLVVVAVGVEGAELNAAAALTGLAVGRRGVQEDDGAVVADAEDGPHVAAHAEDVAGLEGLDIARPGAPALVSKGFGHLGGAHHVAVVVGVDGILGVHHVVDDPADVTRAVETGIVVLVPAVVRIVAVRGVGTVLIGVVGILLLEEVDPALGEADGHGLVGGKIVLPIPARAVDVQRSADGFESGLEVVLEGALACLAADGRGVGLGNKGEVNDAVVDLGGLAGEVAEIGHFGHGGGAGGVVADLIDGAVLDSGAVNGDGGVVDGRDRAFGVGRGSGGVGHDTAFNRQIVDIAFLKLVLDGVLIVTAGDGILHFFAVGVEAMDKVGLAVSFHGAVILHAEIHVSLVADASRTVCLKGGSRRDQKRGKHREDK